MSRYLRDYGELLFTFHLLSNRMESVRLSIPRRRAHSVQWCMSPPHAPESPPPVVRSHSFHCLHRVTACIKVADWRPKGEREGRTADRTATFVSPPNPREKAPLLRSIVPPSLSSLIFLIVINPKTFSMGRATETLLAGWHILSFAVGLPPPILRRGRARRKVFD